MCDICPLVEGLTFNFFQESNYSVQFVTYLLLKLISVRFILKHAVIPVAILVLIYKNNNKKHLPNINLLDNSNKYAIC